MNISRVIEVANSKMGPANEQEKGIFKGSINIDGKEAGTYFIDFTDRADCDSFSFYQENLLANEYYRSREELQWNIYLFLLKDAPNHEFKKMLEKDERYARKYVLQEEEFVQFFEVAVSKNEITNNLIDRLKEELEKIGDSVLSVDKNAADIARIIKRGTAKQVKSKKLLEKKDSVLKMQSITSIQFNMKFRKFLAGEKFEFKKVNLFKGINGAGKTSILEAIELALCGKNFRNRRVTEEDGVINVMFNNSGIWEACKPTVSELFQHRENEWYNKTSTRLNDMCISFNRFNYFNADAAYSFANAMSVEESRVALNNIIFGPEYDLLLDQANKMLEEIRPEYNRISGERGAFEQQKGVYDKKINEWKPKESLSKIAAEIDADLSRFGFINSLPSILEDRVFIEKQIDGITCILRELVEIEIEGPQSIIKYKEEYKKNVSFIAQINELKDDLSDIRNNKRNLEDDLNHLENCVVYFNNPSLFELTGSSERIKNLEQWIARTEHIKMLLESMDFKKYLQSITLEGIISQTKKAILSKKNERNGLNDRLRKEVSRLGKVKEMINQIKVFGKSVIEEEAGRENCPLCDAAINRSQLLERLINNYESEENGYNLDDLQEIISSYESDLDELESDYSLLMNIKDVTRFRNLDISISIGRILAIFCADIEQVNVFQSKLDEEKGLVYFGAQNNVNEVSLQVLTTRLSKKYPDYAFSLENKEYFLNQISHVKQLIQSNSEKYESCRSKMLLYRERFLEEELPEVEIGEWEIFNKIDKRISELGSKVKIIDELLSKLQLLIDVKGSSYKDLIFELDLICDKISIYRKELKLELELEEAMKVSAEMENKLKDGEGKYLEYKDAYQKLDRIKKNPADNHVKSFFDQHMKEVMDVFQSIHVPVEFKELKYNEGALNLIDVNNEQREVTQISTGQRSALAIAIFLTLNRSLKKGPDLIIFDDPMAFVDDLNALSFLDYLRFFVLKENKQIFFATANVKLANLFRRKFQFLGIDDGYKEWDLNHVEREMG